MLLDDIDPGIRSTAFETTRSAYDRCSMQTGTSMNFAVLQRTSVSSAGAVRHLP